jgi:hypothetical protein
MNRVSVVVWLSAKEAAKKLSLSTDSIERRAIPFIETHIPHKIRYKFLQLDEGGEMVRRYYEPDCEALLKVPAPRCRAEDLVPPFA